MVNVAALQETLAALDEDGLNNILDIRDDCAFEDAWSQAYELAPKTRDYPNDKDVFILMSRTTGCHEICSYISDDLNLLHSAQKAGIDSPFLQYLRKAYAAGQVPYQWQGE